MEFHVMAHPQRIALALIALAVLGCSGNSTTVTTATSASTSSVYPAAYQAAKWQSNTSVSFSGACTMNMTTNGVPNAHNTWYLGPVSTSNPTVVATTPVSGLKLGLVSYASMTLKAYSATVNICPTPAATTTATSLGAIGFLITGVPIFNAYEATLTPALADNVSYTFTDTNGVSQTAYFLDSCASHAAPGMNGGASQWHAHGNPNCVTGLVDTASGPSHLIGFALDGYPIYGGRDMNGATIATSQLDGCNGITSVTPEFATPAYHYVLPLGVTGVQSSLPCYHGTVSATVAAAAKRLACRMPGMQMGM